jgi:hypothetical protein
MPGCTTHLNPIQYKLLHPKTSTRDLSDTLRLSEAFHDDRYMTGTQKCSAALLAEHSQQQKDDRVQAGHLICCLTAGKVACAAGV